MSFVNICALSMILYWDFFSILIFPFTSLVFGVGESLPWPWDWL